MLLAIRKSYFDAVNDTLLEGMADSVKLRVEMLTNPLLSKEPEVFCGRDLPSGTFAGAIWYALENELDTYTMSLINHKQNDIMDRVLMELSREL